MTAPSSSKARSYHLCFSIFGKSGDAVICLKIGFPFLPNIKKKLDKNLTKEVQGWGSGYLDNFEQRDEITEECETSHLNLSEKSEHK